MRIVSVKIANTLLPIIILISVMPIFLPTSVDPEVNTASEWKTSTVDSAYNVGLHTSLALDGNDYPHISYYDLSNHSLKYASWTGSNWSIETVDSVGDVGAYTSLVMDEYDYPHIGYYDSTLSNLKYASWTGSNWSIETVDSVGDVGAYTSLALNVLNRPEISYYGGGPDYGLKHARWTGSNWSIEVVALAQVTWTSMALDNGGNPHIIYGDWTNHALKYAMWTGSNWSIETVESIYSSMARAAVDMVLDANDTPYVVYFDEGLSTLKFAVRLLGNWNIETLVAWGHAGSYDSVALDKGGNPHIAYYDEIDEDLRYAKRVGTSWDIEIVDSSDEVGEYASIAMDSSDNPSISYFNLTGKSLKYASKANLEPANRAPVASAGGPYISQEGRLITFDASSSFDPDNDSLVFRWDFDNNGITDTLWSSSPTATHTWGDDYMGDVRVEVSDSKTTVNATTTVTIFNLPPVVDSLTASGKTSATLRVAGEKWHDISVYQVVGGNETFLANLMREPGKPQEASFDINIDVMMNNSLRFAYTPYDDKVNGRPNGATPAWLALDFGSGPPVEMRHTFNVKHPETWNWTMNLNSLLAGREIALSATATDPGSDDVTFTWDWGDSTPTTATTHYNDGIGPDSYPSPDGTSPFTATDLEIHAFAAMSVYIVTLRVMDDDGGEVEVTMTVVFL